MSIIFLVCFDYFGYDSEFFFHLLKYNGNTRKPSNRYREYGRYVKFLLNKIPNSNQNLSHEYPLPLTFAYTLIFPTIKLPITQSDNFCFCLNKPTLIFESLING